MSVTIGQDVETSQEVAIGDIERRSGLYILGEPWMGKTDLLVSLMLQDIKNGHGLFFLDPHGAAIRDLRTRCSPDRRKEVEVLTPESPEFGINLLACRDSTNVQEERAAFERAYRVFRKVFGENWTPGLYTVIANILSVFLENPDCTLADVPRFFRDAEFRNRLIGNVTIHQSAAGFWHQVFAARGEQDQQEELQAAMTRVGMLFSHPSVSNIVGKRETTIDFTEAMEKQRILLMNIPGNLASEVKTFIGALILSELLQAVRWRPMDKREQFCVYIDEFQHFLTNDFAYQITEARGEPDIFDEMFAEYAGISVAEVAKRKEYGVAYTISQQERRWHVGDEGWVFAAANAAANKIVFQLTGNDAKAMAREFALKAQDIAGLSPFTAYAKVIHEDSGEHVVWKGKIRVIGKAAEERVL